MRAVVQRVKDARVEVGGAVVGSIERGLLVYLGVAIGDSVDDAIALAEKAATLRIFRDAEGKMNRSVVDEGGSVLVVSQFTLLADARKGRRPSYSDAAPPDVAEALYKVFIARLESEWKLIVGSGRFQADMSVSYTNEGPVTILLDSKKAF